MNLGKLVPIRNITMLRANRMFVVCLVLWDMHDDLRDYLHEKRFSSLTVALLEYE